MAGLHKAERRPELQQVLRLECVDTARDVATLA
jgi:hypothetical protein